MTTEQRDYAAILDAFLASDDFPEAVAQSTRASWSGGSYKVELFPGGDWRVLWSSEIGNKYETPGLILTVPTAPDEWGDLSDDDVLGEAITVNLSDVAAEMREQLSDMLAQEQPA
jgi:uncharacterized protein YndB with AHSA1/START domain